MSENNLRRSTRLSSQIHTQNVLQYRQSNTPKTRSQRLADSTKLISADDNKNVEIKELSNNAVNKTPSKRIRRKKPSSPSSLMANLSLKSPQKKGRQQQQPTLVVVSSDDEIEEVTTTKNNEKTTKPMIDGNKLALQELIRLGVIDPNEHKIDNNTESVKNLDFLNHVEEPVVDGKKLALQELIRLGVIDPEEHKIDDDTESEKSLDFLKPIKPLNYIIDLSSDVGNEVVDLTTDVQSPETPDCLIYYSDNSEENETSPAVSKKLFRQPQKILSSSEDEEDDDNQQEKIDLFSPPIKEKKTVRKSLHKEAIKESITDKNQSKLDKTSSESKTLRTPRKEKSKTDPAATMGTPPKMRKLQNDENEPKAPPSTPNNQNAEVVKSSSKPSPSRKQLFNDNNNLYKNARQALHSAYPTEMPGRQKELDGLRKFITNHLENGSSGSLYVSGPPGTGKTASLNHILEEEEIMMQIKHIYVNCTTIKSSSSIFGRIAKDLGIKSSGKTEKDYIQAIEQYLNKNHKTILLVLDEIDQLESKKQSVLYTIFEWPSNPKSRLILIGIANALDLTDRILPRLQSRCELQPQLLHFPPYTKQQIVEIFTSRLRSANVLHVFSRVAIEMLAGKVASISGDVRRALDIGRRVIELVQRNKKDDNLLKSIENFTQQLDSEQQQPPKAVELKEVVNVLSNVYGTGQNFSDDVDESFPLQQKIVVCTLVLILKKAKNKDVTIGRLHDVYRKVCTKRNIQVVDQGEFVGLCSLIETRGIIRVIKKKDPRMSKISLMWDEDEVGNALKDKQLMSTILQDDVCLGKL